MRDTRASAGGMRSAIERSGYYPGVVSDAVSAALGQEPVVSYVVQHDPADPGGGRLHTTVLVLTPDRLVTAHRRAPGGARAASPGRDEHRGRPVLARFRWVTGSCPASYLPGVTSRQQS